MPSDRLPEAGDAVQRLSAAVHGRVQGVGFRHFTRVTARRLCLAGFVRNDPDGSVTVVAEGERSRLDELLAALRQGPGHAHVADVEVRWEPPRDEFDGFSVAH